MGVKEKLAATRKQMEISQKVFANSVMKDREGNEVPMPELGKTYLLYSKETDKKIGWVKMPDSYDKAGAGWCNLPAYLKMSDPPEKMPYGLTAADFSEVDPAEYGLPEAEPVQRRLPEIDAEDYDEEKDEGFGK